MAKPSKSETVKPVVVAAAAGAADSVAPVSVKKEKAPKVAKEVAAAAAAAPAIAAVEQQPPKKKTKTAAVVAVAATAVESAAVIAPAAVEETTNADATLVAETSSIGGDFADFFGKLQQISAQLASLRTDFRSLERKASREIKTATKAGAKRKRKTGNRSPSGFVKPTLISVDLAAFLGKPHGTEMARTEVTREINAYIRANNLQDKTNGRKINADAKLASLLKLTAGGEDLTYFNLQRYMSPHFQKSAAAAAAVSTPVA
jgi:chromatin remodeling complex protein RSC6